MKTYKITLEIVLKDTANLKHEDFILQGIEQVLETSEFIDSYEYEEITQ